MSDAHWYRLIDRLSPAQRRAFDAVCCGLHPVAAPRTMKALEEKGLILGREETLPGRFPVKVREYEFASYAVHVAWCQWCSDHLPEGQK